MSLLLRTIEAFPRGRTTVELEVLLDRSFDPAGRQLLRAELLELQSQGRIIRGRDGRWRAIRSTVSARPPAMGSARDEPTATQDDILSAVPGRFLIDTTNAGPNSAEGPIEDTSSPPPEPKALLRYYRAALLSDTRGAVAEAVDRYATSFLFVSGTGPVFPVETTERTEVVIEIGSDALPASFREALARRDDNERSLAVGWPMAVIRRQGVPRIIPVGLIPASWEQSGEQTRIRLETTRIVANPEWLTAAGRRQGWTRARLIEIFAGPDGEGHEPESFLERLRECAAREIRGRLTLANFAAQIDPASEGIRGALGLFLPTGSTFNAGAVRDLDALAQWPRERIAETALGRILGLPARAMDESVAPINISTLNAEQIRAVELACREPLSVVTGPPGTGKSQAIVSMVASTLLIGGSVVVASRNHQALDAVEDRLREIAPKLSFSVRTLDPRRDIDQRIVDVLRAILSEPETRTGSGPMPELLSDLRNLARRRQEALDQHERRIALHTALSDDIERLELFHARLAEHGHREAPPAPVRSPWRRLLEWLGLRRRMPAPRANHPDDRTSIARIEARIKDARRELAALPEPEDPVALTERIVPLARELLAEELRQRIAVDEVRRLELHDHLDNLIQRDARQMPAEVAKEVIQHRPLWLVSALGVPRRIPLAEGLFDLAIFDEASQCDIASALPVLARARRAVIVGDDKQLSFISAIGVRQDRNLMLANGVPLEGTGRFAQGRNSLFDLAQRTPGVPRVILRNQYRSAPEIVDWLNAEFYAGRLRASVDPQQLKLPKGARPGIAWTHVPGPVALSAKRGNVNEFEVGAIVSELRKLLIDQGYDGSVGIITPFRPQVLAIAEAVEAAIPDEVRARVELRIGTVDSFQGQERDLILFSPVVHAGAQASAISFLQKDWRRLNVAISRARAVAHVFGDRSFARSGRITALRKLLERATTSPPARGEGVFDSEIERIVFAALRKRGLDPEPQYEVIGRRLDFALFHDTVQLDLEIDGRRWHQDVDGNRKIGDLWRDAQLKALGWKVRRFWVDELKADMEGCLDTVEQDLGLE